MAPACRHGAGRRQVRPEHPSSEIRTPVKWAPKVQNRGWFRTCLTQTGAKPTQVLIFAYRLRSAAWNAISSKRQKLTHGDFLTFRTSLQKRSQRLPRSHIYSKSAPLARRRGKVNAPPPPGDPGEIVIFDAGPRRNFFSPTSFSETASVEDFFNWLRNRI